ncbi:T9SS type A sorting domain-containing protein [Aureivirga marina]|uniref:T9SS type A sorting domain-containing protein n=1 Tax=Aureivirga marina TaxID=1182451 RepID=UPI0018CACD9A|nr:T9SS type A sorting domain-containing protein [Aureivirga marina]
MKKILILILFVFVNSFGQEISTDPTNPINEERPDMLNHFNWMSEEYNVYHPIGGYTNGSNNFTKLPNPYFGSEEYQKHFNLHNIPVLTSFEDKLDSLDFHPKNGWELIHKHNGFMNDETTLITNALDNRNGPYVILYNKYTGKLRVLASFDNIGNPEKITTDLYFKEANSLKSTALFNHYGRVSQPLDQETKITRISQSSKGAINKGFIDSDFQMGYDPCSCENKSELFVSFEELTEEDVLLEGRLIGTSVPLDGSGESPLLNRKNFLTAVYGDDFSVNGGMLTYSNIDSLVQHYKAPERGPIDELIEDGFKAALKGGGKALDKNVINKGAVIVFDSLFSDVPFYKKGSKASLGVGAAVTNFLSSALFPNHSVPNISFIEAEMVLSGSVTNENPFNNGSINIVTPGSKDSNLSPWQNYPLYNKTLGLFTLLETPKVNFAYETEEDRVSRDEIKITSTRYYGIDSNSLKFTFNPDANVNVAKTKIYGGLVLIHKYSGYNHSQFIDDVVKRDSNLQTINIENSKGEYITPIVPLDKLGSIIPKSREYYKRIFLPTGNLSPELKTNIEVQLRIIIEYEFNENNYGEVNKSMQILTYPVELIKKESIINSYENLLSIPENRVISSPTTDNGLLINVPKRAWNHIQINPGYLSNGFNYAHTVKSKRITIKSGVRLKPKNSSTARLTFTSGIPLNRTSVINQVDQQYLDYFCENKYKGNVSNLNARTIGKLDEIQNDLLLNNRENIVSLFPNPTRDNITISSEVEMNHITILDVFGNVKYKRTVKGKSLNINVSTYQTGLFYLSVILSDGTTKRIPFQKN